MTAKQAIIRFQVLLLLAVSNSPAHGWTSCWLRNRNSAAAFVNTKENRLITTSGFRQSERWSSFGNSESSDTRRLVTSNNNHDILARFNASNPQGQPVYVPPNQNNNSTYHDDGHFNRAPPDVSNLASTPMVSPFSQTRTVPPRNGKKLVQSSSSGTVSHVVRTTTTTQSFPQTPGPRVAQSTAVPAETTGHSLSRTHAQLNKTPSDSFLSSSRSGTTSSNNDNGDGYAKARQTWDAAVARNVTMDDTSSSTSLQQQTPIRKQDTVISKFSPHQANWKSKTPVVNATYASTLQQPLAVNEGPFMPLANATTAHDVEPTQQRSFPFHPPDSMVTSPLRDGITPFSDTPQASKENNMQPPIFSRETDPTLEQRDTTSSMNTLYSPPMEPGRERSPPPRIQDNAPAQQPEQVMSPPLFPRENDPALEHGGTMNTQISPPTEQWRDRATPPPRLQDNAPMQQPREAMPPPFSQGNMRLEQQTDPSLRQWGAMNMQISPSTEQWRDRTASPPPRLQDNAPTEQVREAMQPPFPQENIPLEQRMDPSLEQRGINPQFTPATTGQWRESAAPPRLQDNAPMQQPREPMRPPPVLRENMPLEGPVDPAWEQRGSSQFSPPTEPMQWRERITPGVQHNLTSSSPPPERTPWDYQAGPNFAEPFVGPDSTGGYLSNSYSQSNGTTEIYEQRNKEASNYDSQMDNYSQNYGHRQPETSVRENVIASDDTFVANTPIADPPETYNFPAAPDEISVSNNPDDLQPRYDASRFLTGDDDEFYSLYPAAAAFDDSEVEDGGHIVEKEDSGSLSSSYEGPDDDEFFSLYPMMATEPESDSRDDMSEVPKNNEDEKVPGYSRLPERGEETIHKSAPATRANDNNPFIRLQKAFKGAEMNPDKKDEPSKTKAQTETDFSQASGAMRNDTHPALRQTPINGAEIHLPPIESIDNSRRPATMSGPDPQAETKETDRFVQLQQAFKVARTNPEKQRPRDPKSTGLKDDGDSGRGSRSGLTDPFALRRKVFREKETSREKLRVQAARRAATAAKSGIIGKHPSALNVETPPISDVGDPPPESFANDQRNQAGLDNEPDSDREGVEEASKSGSGEEGSLPGRTLNIGLRTVMSTLLNGKKQKPSLRNCDDWQVQTDKSNNIQVGSRTKTKDADHEDDPPARKKPIIVPPTDVHNRTSSVASLADQQSLVENPSSTVVDTLLASARSSSKDAKMETSSADGREHSVPASLSTLESPNDASNETSDLHQFNANPESVSAKETEDVPSDLSNSTVSKKARITVTETSEDHKEGALSDDNANNIWNVTETSEVFNVTDCVDMESNGIVVVDSLNDVPSEATATSQREGPVSNREDEDVASPDTVVSSGNSSRATSDDKELLAADSSDTGLSTGSDDSKDTKRQRSVATEDVEAKHPPVATEEADGAWPDVDFNNLGDSFRNLLP